MSRRLVEKELETSSKTYSRKEGCWNYIPAGMAEEEEITPQKIIGDIGYRSKKEEAAFLLGEEGTEVSVNPFKAKLGYGQKVLGYIPCEEEDGGVIYVRVIGKSWGKILIPLVILLALIAGGLWWYFAQNRGPDLDDSAMAYQMPGGLKNEDPSQIMLPGFGTIDMEAGQRTVHAALSNPEGNPCYFKYTVSLQEGGDVLYESGWLEPGTAVTKWEIAEELEPGDYPISLLVDTGSLDDYQQEMNKGTINATLHVE